jgi:hypothetical protein
MVGFSAYMQADHASRLGAVALINGPGDVRKVVEYALEVMRAVHAGEAIPPPPGIPHPAHIENASEYEGRYRDGSKSLTLAAANDSRLVLRWKGEQINLEHRGQDTFYTPHPAFDRYFLHCGRDESGEVNRLTHGPSLLWKVGFAERTEKTSDQNWHVFTGHFRSYSPWLSYFEVLEREGSLILITGESGESTSGETRLAPVGPGSFRVGTRLSPEILEFEELVEGRALKAVWSGHPFYRTP